MKMTLALAGVLFLLAHCGGSGSGGAGGGMSGTYRLSGYDTVARSLVNTCSEDPPASSPNRANVSAQEVAGSPRIQVSFSGNQFTISQGGSVILSGTYSLIDTNTLEIFFEGTELSVNFNLDEDTLTLLTGSLVIHCENGHSSWPANSNGVPGNTNGVDTDQSVGQANDEESPPLNYDSPANAGTPVSSGTPATPLPAPSDEEILTSALQGTWCHESGYRAAGVATVASLSIDGNRRYIGLVNGNAVRYYTVTDLWLISSQLQRFFLRYYSPNTHVADWTLHGDTLELYYEPLRTSVLRRVSLQEVQCPGP